MREIGEATRCTSSGSTRHRLAKGRPTTASSLETANSQAANATDSRQGYQIQVSDDGTHWITIYSATAPTGGVQNLIGLAGNGRYTRMNETARGTGYGYSLRSFEVNGR